MDFEILSSLKASTGEMIVCTVEKQTRKLHWFVDPIINEKKEIVAARNVITEDDMLIPGRDE